MKTWIALLALTVSPLFAHASSDVCAIALPYQEGQVFAKYQVEGAGMEGNDSFTRQFITSDGTFELKAHRSASFMNQNGSFVLNTSLSRSISVVLYKIDGQKKTPVQTATFQMPSRGGVVIYDTKGIGYSIDCATISK